MLLQGIDEQHILNHFKSHKNGVNKGRHDGQLEG